MWRSRSFFHNAANALCPAMLMILSIQRKRLPLQFGSLFAELPPPKLCGVCLFITFSESACLRIQKVNSSENHGMIDFITYNEDRSLEPGFGPDSSDRSVRTEPKQERDIGKVPQESRFLARRHSGSFEDVRPCHCMVSRLLL
jgi:hypothetical protein